MLRPIPPHVAWQAMAALAGVFTLVCALAAPVDLWRLSVKSRQGEPFLAIATLASLPEERITDSCLSMGPESDAPGSGMHFLSEATLKLTAGGSAVEITTTDPINVPALALVLRVQCAGAPFYARHFSALIPPASGKPRATNAAPAINKTTTPSGPAPQSAAGTPSVQGRGFRLSVLPGDSVESIAAVLFPANRRVQQQLTQQVIAGNPKVFPNGQPRDVAPGTVLWFPDLRALRQTARAEDVSAGPSSADPATVRRRGPRQVTPQQDTGAQSAAPRSREPVTLRRALELGDKPGPQECRQLMQLCGAETAAVAPIAPALDEKARAIESGVQQLQLKQDSIDQQLQRLEQSLRTLQSSINTPLQPAPAPPPRVEIRTVVKSEPLPWTLWLGLAGLLLVAAIGGFAYGRRGSFSRGLAETDEQLDRMLATAANVMRELDTTRQTPAAAAPVAPPQPPTPAAAARASAESRPVSRPPVSAPPPQQPSELAPASKIETPDLLLDAQSAQPTASVDLELESAPSPGTEQASPSQNNGLSTNVLYEMDQALDNTRSMFTDVDRFIALGRTQNALSLLQFQVHKDPKDRDSWIKLMAIYRQEKMDVELARAAREFKSNFPSERPPSV